MMLIPARYIATRYIAAVTAACILVIGAKMYISSVETSGYERGKAEGKAEMKVLIDAADKRVRDIQLEQEIDNARLKAEHAQRIAEIERFYANKNRNDIDRLRAEYVRRMRMQTASQTGAVASSVCDARDDGPASESTATGHNTISGCPLEVERACVRDANMINTWRAWAERHGIKVE